MQVLEQLLKDNADVCDTRHDMLTGAEVSAIEDALARLKCLFVLNF